MLFLQKPNSSSGLTSDWRYPRDRTLIRRCLIADQEGYCAYSEKFLNPVDAVEVEHFDPRKKNTDEDCYRNWYAVIRWMNLRKPLDIGSYEPMPDPTSSDLRSRFAYRDGVFQCAADGDEEGGRLIDFLGVNRPELVEERRNRIVFLRDLLQNLLVGDRQLFISFLRRYPDMRSFFSAIAHEFGIEKAEVF